MRRSPALAIAAVLTACAPRPSEPTTRATTAEPHAAAASEAVGVVPRPRDLVVLPGSVRWAHARLVASERASAAAVRLAADLRLRGIDVLPDGATAPDVVDVALGLDDSSIPPEGYRLSIAGAAVDAKASTPAGLFYATRTLLQLFDANPARSLPHVVIRDAPRFAWRGVHLDEARHFFGRAYVEHLLDVASAHKLNVLHWHLTDDQGWRLPVAHRPRLTEVGGQRDGTEPTAHGAYSEDDIRAVVAYAAERFVTVVPEIEWPGHTRAALAAYPELSCRGVPQPVPTTWGVFDDVLCVGNRGTYDLVDDVLRDAARLFPGPFVHLGGDEVPTTHWRTCPKCQAVMRREGLTDVAQLEPYFFRRAATRLSALGKRPMAWDEAVNPGDPAGCLAGHCAIPEDTVITAWRGRSALRAAIRAGHDAIAVLPTATYFDSKQSRADPFPADDDRLVPWTQVYGYDPVPADWSPDESRHVLGVEAALWTEHVASTEEADRRYFPRVFALAEVAWTPRAAMNVDDFADRMNAHASALAQLGARGYLEPPRGLEDDHVFVGRTRVVLEAPALARDARIEVAVRPFSVSGPWRDDEFTAYRGPLDLSDSVTIAARAAIEGGRKSDTASATFRRQEMLPAIAPASLPSLAPGLTYEYAEGRFDRVPSPFPKPLRSGTLPAVELPPDRARDRFAVRLSGWVRVDESGVHAFRVTADDGAILTIDGHVVVDDDGPHSRRTRQGEVALAAGLHAIVLAYFQRWGDAKLELASDLAALPYAPVPAEALFHDPSHLDSGPP